MKVYVCEDRDYESLFIVGVFSSMESLRRFLEVSRKHEDYYTITEHELDGLLENEGQ